MVSLFFFLFFFFIFPVEILNWESLSLNFTVKGYHLMYEGTPIDPAIKSWNVTRLQVRLNELTILNFF